jgi:tRNA (guanosine-2'-O-)-methyltransferase
MTEGGRPITQRRLARMQGTLARRQPDLTVVVENVHDPHNVSAILRSCDAVGAASAHLVYAREERPDLSKGVAASAQRWIDLHNYETARECYAAMRSQGFVIYATSLTHDSRDLYDLDLTKPTAFVFGNESLGISEDAATLADATVYIPMMGMVESLNVSVACAVALYEALRQRRATSQYTAPGWSFDEIERRLRTWLVREHRNPEAATSALDMEMPKARNRYLHRE